MLEEDRKAINESIEGSRQYHTNYLRAINNPVRRMILKALKDGSITLEALESDTKLDARSLTWHLSILEQGLCVEKKEKGGSVVFKLTQEGEVVNYLE